MRRLVKVFKALSDPNRIRIIKMLEVRSLCVCEITEVLQLANSTVSKHLSILRDAELIVDRKEGRWVNYQLNPSQSEPYVRDLVPLLSKWLPDDEVIRSDRQKVKVVNRDMICAA